MDQEDQSLLDNLMGMISNQIKIEKESDNFLGTVEQLHHHFQRFYAESREKLLSDLINIVSFMCLIIYFNRNFLVTQRIRRRTRTITKCLHLSICS